MRNTWAERNNIEKALYQKDADPGGFVLIGPRRLAWRPPAGKLAEREALIADYKRRLVAERMADADFRAALDRARAVYCADVGRIALDQDEGPLAYAARPVISGLRERLALNRGWVLWLAHYLETGESEPDKLLLFLSRRKDGYLQADVYFPLPKALWDWLAVQMRMAEPDAFGDYYHSKRGRPAGRATRRHDRELEQDRRRRDNRLANGWKKAAAADSSLTKRGYCKENPGIDRRALDRALARGNSG